MATPEPQSLQAIQDQLASILEERITELMTHIKASQALSRQIARTEEEVERQRLLRDQLESELGPLRQQAADLTSETEGLQREVDSLLENISRMRNIREELLAIKGDDSPSASASAET